MKEKFNGWEYIYDFLGAFVKTLLFVTLIGWMAEHNSSILNSIWKTYALVFSGIYWAMYPMIRNIINAIKNG